MRRLAVLLLLAGCSVVDEPYPARWDPLPPTLPADCLRFQGTYADRGESPAKEPKPSLTRELFGAQSPWEKAVSVEFAFGEQALDIRVAAPGANAFSRRLAASSGEFACEGGKLVVRNRRWVTSDLMSGREIVKIEMYQADPQLVARVDETTTGLMFMVVPLSGESVKWYRFPRLKP